MPSPRHADAYLAPEAPAASRAERRHAAALARRYCPAAVAALMRPVNGPTSIYTYDLSEAFATPVVVRQTR